MRCALPAWAHPEAGTTGAGGARRGDGAQAWDRLAAHWWAGASFCWATDRSSRKRYRLGRRDTGQAHPCAPAVSVSVRPVRAPLRTCVCPYPRSYGAVPCHAGNRRGTPLCFAVSAGLLGSRGEGSRSTRRTAWTRVVTARGRGLRRRAGQTSAACSSEVVRTWTQGRRKRGIKPVPHRSPRTADSGNRRDRSVPCRSRPTGCRPGAPGARPDRLCPQGCGRTPRRRHEPQTGGGRGGACRRCRIGSACCAS